MLVTSAHRFSCLRAAAACVLAAAAWLSTAQWACGEAAKTATEEYAKTIAAAQLALDEGRPDEARERLAATEESQRGFEHRYLAARLKAAAAGSPAPDLINVIAAPEVATRYAVLNPTNGQVAFLCKDGKVRLADLKQPTNEPQTAAYQGDAPIWSGAFSQDGTTLVTGHGSGGVVVWDAESWKPRFELSLGGDSPVREIAVAPDGTSLVAEGASELELWSLTGDTPTKVAGVGERYRFGEGLAFSPVGDLVATGGMFDILLHDASTGELRGKLSHASYTMGITFSPSGERLASAPRGNVNKLLAVFDVATKRQLFGAGPFECYVHGGVFSAEGKRIASTACGKVPVLQLFDADTGVVVFSLSRDSAGRQPAFSRDSQVFGWSEASGFHYIDLGG